MPCCTSERWQNRRWTPTRCDLVDGRSEYALVAWGVPVTKRLIAHPADKEGRPQAAASISGGMRFDLDAHSRLEWQDVPTLAALETWPGELAHSAVGGAHLSTLYLDAAPEAPEWRHEISLPTGCRVRRHVHVDHPDAATSYTPPALDGGYVVYDSTGCQIAAIPRPLAVSRNRKRLWGRIDITQRRDGTWLSVVSFGAARLAALAPPLIICGMDTFGFTSIGSSNGNVSSYLRAYGATPASSGTLDSIHIYTDGTDTFRMGVYDDSGGVPDNLVDQTAESALPSATQWHQLALNSQSIAGGNTYHNGWSASGLVRIYYNSSGGNYHYYGSSGFQSPMPDPFGSPGGSGSVNHSIYSTYTPGGGPFAGRKSALLGGGICG